MNKFKVGDRVRITSEGSHRFKVGYIGNITHVGHPCIGQPYKVDMGPSNWVYSDEIELIKEEGMKVGRRTFKLLRDTEWLSKGALFQEACDDGDQKYILITDSIRWDDADTYGLVQEACGRSRDAVEKNPQWFVEVFKSNIDYMTREELDRWNAYRSGKTATKAPATKSTTVSKPKVSNPGSASLQVSADTIERFARVYNSSRTTSSVMQKLNLSRAAVTTYKWAAKKRGYELKDMPKGQ